MARALLRQGVTSFLPTAPSLPEAELPRFAERVRGWIPDAPDDGAQPLGFNLEGPFLAPSRKGAHDPAVLRTPDELGDEAIGPLLDGLRVMTIAPELPGALALIERLSALGIVASLGHSASTLDEARAGYVAGGPVDDPPVQRDDRRRPPGAGPRRRRADRRRGLRRADRRRAARPPGGVADHHPHQARRPAAAGRATRCRSPGWATGGRPSAGSRSRCAADGARSTGSDDAGGVGDRARHRGAEPRRARARRSRRPSPRRRRTPRPCSTPATAGGSSPAAGPTWSSSTTTCGCAASPAAPAGSRAPADPVTRPIPVTPADRAG